LSRCLSSTRNSIPTPGMSKTASVRHTTTADATIWRSSTTGVLLRSTRETPANVAESRGRVIWVELRYSDFFQSIWPGMTTRLYGEAAVLDIWIEPLSDNSRMVGKSDTDGRRLSQSARRHFVVDNVTNSLLAAKISLSCLNGNVPKQELDLLQFAAGPDGGWINSQVLGANGGFAHLLGSSFCACAIGAS